MSSKTSKARRVINSGMARSGYTLEGLAEYLGVSRQTLVRHLDKGTLTIKEVVALRKVLYLGDDDVIEICS